MCTDLRLRFPSRTSGNTRFSLPRVEPVLWPAGCHAPCQVKRLAAAELRGSLTGRAAGSGRSQAAFCGRVPGPVFRVRQLGPVDGFEIRRSRLDHPREASDRVREDRVREDRVRVQRSRSEAEARLHGAEAALSLDGSPLSAGVRRSAAVQPHEPVRRAARAGLWPGSLPSEIREEGCSPVVPNAGGVRFPPLQVLSFRRRAGSREEAPEDRRAV